MKEENKENSERIDLKQNKKRENKDANPPIKKRRKKTIEINAEKTSGDVSQKSSKRVDNTHLELKLKNDLIKVENSPFEKNFNENKEKLKVNKSIIKFTDYELNTLPYNEALRYDKRNYFEYYISLLKTRHILLFSFCPSNDYNSRIIKIYLFFYSFAMYCTVNALFFSDSTMHKIYTKTVAHLILFIKFHKLFILQLFQVF